MGKQLPIFDLNEAITLEDKYTATSGKVFMNGTQALVRLPMVQLRRDKEAGFNTGAFISGYRGSPVGGFDFALQAAKHHLKKQDIVFQPGVNEELAATAIWGAQQLSLSPGAKKDGIVGIWYGKGPGVDRSGDALRHANAFGTHPLGGVLAIAGDDHMGKSSTVLHQSDHGFISTSIPMLYPTSVQEFTEMGLLGIAMSRYTGTWTGYKVTSDTIETTGVIDLSAEQRKFIIPDDFELPEGGLNIRWPDDRFLQDQRLIDHKINAVLAFARVNQVDQHILAPKKARFGIAASGKAYENVREALRLLGIDAKTTNKIGVRLYKVRMPWPLEPVGIKQFAQGLDEVLVIEERREIIEDQIKQQLYNWPESKRPRIVGKFDTDHKRLVPTHEEINASLALQIIAERLLKFNIPDDFKKHLKEKLKAFALIDKKSGAHNAPVSRIAHFCSGCPHNTSTKVPDGSRALAGIGCHFMSLWMDRNTETYTHMGGEGIPWTGAAPFTDEKHVFANIGDGTYFHSGVMAIRQAVASGANITYKILFNDAVAMTGGQALDGNLSVPQLSHQLKAEGVKEIWIVSDEPERYQKSQVALGAIIKHRDFLDEAQKHLREVPGCTAIIYDQTCATEKRRKRKRGQLADPDKRAFINPLVCEGCGDCSVQSNCISIEPLETEFGRKRQINQSSCNKDFSCINGFCPSFVTVEGAALRKRKLPAFEGNALPDPQPAPLEGVYNIAITGVGGTGVLTIGAIIGMAAHIEGKAALIQDFSGLAQKGGAVLSHVRLANTTDLVSSAQIISGEADLLLAADTVVASSKETVKVLNSKRTNAVLNTHLSPVSNFVFDRDFDFRESAVVKTIAKVVKEKADQIDFAKLSEIVCGDSIATNIMMVGYAFQKGLIPVSSDALLKAIELNGIAVNANILAFNWGRKFAESPKEIAAIIERHFPALEQNASLDKYVAKRAEFLTDYQDEKLASKFRSQIEAIKAAESAISKSEILTRTCAQNYFKLLSIKDEYEVARLFSNGEFEKEINKVFEGDFKVNYHLAPPIFGGMKHPNGRPRKRQFGPSTKHLFKLLAKMKALRGTPFDIFGYTAERKMERGLVEAYETILSEFTGKLTEKNLAAAIELANYPNKIRGFGPVKEKSAEKADETKKQLLERFRKPIKPSARQNPERVAAE